MVTWYRAVLALGLVLSVSQRAQAHRLDEYLQQTLITLAPERIMLALHLTPGVDIAPALIALVDQDHDGTLSEREQAQYAGTVLRDLSLRMDGTELPLLLRDASYPPLAAMREGVGTISLSFESAPRGGLTSGTLRFVNRHHVGGPSTYLVNTFLPRAATLHVGTQTRNADQSTYQLDLTRDAPLNSGLTMPIALVLAGAATLVLWATGRRRHALPTESQTATDRG